MITVMLRTRDFVLLFVTIIFLIVAIGATFLSSVNRSGDTGNALLFVDKEDVEYSVEIYSPEVLSRSEKLADMRQKIADSRVEYISSPVIHKEEETELVVDENTEESIQVLNKCPNYLNYSGVWMTQDIKFEVVSNARLVYREVMIEEGLTASSTEVNIDSNKEILLELPVSPIGSGFSCISRDVIGVAQDGSLIRNSETGLYGVFGENTLVGYALDGFPIYGSTSRELDECGGTDLGSGYGYYISDESENILNCFKSTPISI